MVKAFNGKVFAAELLGTAILVLVACGVAVFSGVDLVATSLAFGLTIVALAYAIGPVSGCHVNPAVSFGLAVVKRISWFEFIWYCLAQFIGAIGGAALLLAVQKLAGVETVTALGQNGFDASSAVGLTMGGAVLVEVVLTFIFVVTILVTTSKTKGANGKAGIVIGLTLTLVHLLGINLTGTSVNPARSFGPALLVGGVAIEQVWVFIVAPLVGAALAALFAKFVVGTEKEPALLEPESAE
ncbi:MAG: aquaporin [Clostridiales bacterium]|jgi:aquaporin Z|nr:aquaporin [Clostridiales bacterium]